MLKTEKSIEYIAHIRKTDGQKQMLSDHLLEVSKYSGCFSSRIGFQKAGELIGLLHDLGKYSNSFQNYLKSSSGLLKPDDDGYMDSAHYKGKIDHSSAGAQWLWTHFKEHGKKGIFIGQILSLCIASHHSGLINCLNKDGENIFLKRMSKDDEKTHLKECLINIDQNISDILSAIDFQDILNQILPHLKKLSKEGQSKIVYFYFGMLSRFLLSCLIDADRISTADFENLKNKLVRRMEKPDWKQAIKNLEETLLNFNRSLAINKIRQKISDQCKDKAFRAPGIFSLTVPTGGGKTLASLRFALYHAHKHGMEKIIYIIPYTSIIEQNANKIREVLNISEKDDWVLEIHSNLEPEMQTWQSKLVSENWDSPIILTTMVQFLDVLFNSGTNRARIMHQLANSILIFDEIQTLPIKCTHIFCNSINFLTKLANTTAVLCTATQPLLNQLSNPQYGQLNIPAENELIENVENLFDELKRVNIVNNIKVNGWNLEDITSLVLGKVKEKGNCLVIVNTKDWAQKLYISCKEKSPGFSIYHLSTNLCPKHRKDIFANINHKLDKCEPLLCISTQLIEAGVDIDFSSVIRFVAGLDSIVQAAGRCNRNNKRETADVLVINPDSESIGFLTDIKEGKDVALRIFNEQPDADYTSPQIMDKYFYYYFYKRSDDMRYNISKSFYGRDENLLSLLSDNASNPGKTATPTYLLRQSFMDAGKIFKTINAPTQAIIVPYQDGVEIIGELCSHSITYDPNKFYQLLRKAQRFSINIFPKVFQELRNVNALRKIRPGEEIFYLDEKFYSDEFGLVMDGNAQISLKNY